MEKLKRKEREFRFRRTEILEEAEKIFALKGFHETTMAEIARSAGFATGSLYQFFEGKEDLYATMMTEKLSLMFTEIEAAVSRGRDTPGKLRALVSSHFKFVEENMDFYRLLVRGEGISYSDGHSSLKDQIIRYFLDHVDFIDKLIREGVKQKLFKNTNTRAMAYSLMGIMSFFKFMSVMKPEGSLMKKVPIVLDMFLKGVGRDGAS
ncbi:MAG: TetR/AcrR family transcriptional regulator [Deltaproteobacteria bacterium]|nr:TetR/AcrR family transcriptional regulator [Deltaproteobacteria bacterium]